ncbi:hypothetical protein DYB36_009665, partial [Aphanomyces astaci]
MQRSIRVSIDRGGTFTDVYAEMGTSASDVQVKVIKLLSEDPANYPDAPREGIRRILEEFTGIPHPRNQPVDTSRLEYIRMGTTVATNALLERNGERTALVITKGFRDLLYIGNQSRPKIFDLEITSPDMLYEEVVEVNERVQLVFENDRRPTDIRGVSGDYVRVLDPLDLVDLRAQLSAVRAKGIKSVAVVLVHSYTFTQHEQQIGSLAHELGFSQISLSSEIMPMIKMVPRGFTSCADAYLTPVIKDYLHSFCSGFDSNLNDVKISFMQSDGGLTPMSSFFGNRAILSGPAGGVVGYARTTRPPRLPAPLPVIGFDMGGTSTDVSRYDGTFEHVFESVTANVPIRAPQLDIQTVAAGGGSRLFYKNQLFVVGPESVRAHPGPVCYRKNGYLSVTDANLVTGRIVPQRSTKYSLGCVVENEPLDVEGTRKAFQTLSDEINASQQTAYSVEAIASGFLRVANEAMCRPIRNLTQMRGFDITTHVLACFGGAGPQHACSIAKALGYDVVEAYYVVGGLTIWLHRMSKVYIQRYSGILSAYGLSLADSVIDKQWPASCPYVASEKPSLVAKLQSLASVVLADLKAEGFDETHSTLEYFLNLRYEGTDTALMTRAVLPAGTTVQAGLLAFDFDTAFTTKYQQEFGFLLHARSVLVDDIRVRGTFSPPSNSQSTPTTISTTSASPHATTPLYFDELNAWKPVPVYLHSEMLHTQTVVQGPAIIMQNQATVVVESEWTAEILPNGDLYLYLSAPSSALADQVHDQDVAPVVVMDPIQLSVFSHRFMGIAEQMGRTLARTSVSVNIKVYPPTTLLGDYTDPVEVKAASSSGGVPTRVVVDGLRPGTSYQFKVSAASRMGEGPFSAPSAPIQTIPLNWGGTCLAGWVQYHKQRWPAPWTSRLWFHAKMLPRYAVIDSHAFVWYKNEAMALKHRSMKKRKRMKTSFLTRDVSLCDLSESTYGLAQVYAIHVVAIARNAHQVRYTIQLETADDLDRWVVELGSLVPRHAVGDRLEAYLEAKGVPLPPLEQMGMADDDDDEDGHRSEWSSVTGDESWLSDAEDEELCESRNIAALVYLAVYSFFYSLQDASMRHESQVYEEDDEMVPSWYEMLTMIINAFRSNSRNVCCVAFLCNVPKTRSAIQPMVYFGLYKFDGIANPDVDTMWRGVAWNFVVILCILFHRRELQLRGMWHKSVDHQHASTSADATSSAFDHMNQARHTLMSRDSLDDMDAFDVANFLARHDHDADDMTDAKPAPVSSTTTKPVVSSSKAVAFSIERQNSVADNVVAADPMEDAGGGETGGGLSDGREAVEDLPDRPVSPREA